jgi:DnaJ-class molecular chaperone
VIGSTYIYDQNPKGKEKFVEIQEAYELLADPQRKRHYDLGGDVSLLAWRLA